MWEPRVRRFDQLPLVVAHCGFECWFEVGDLYAIERERLQTALPISPLAGFRSSLRWQSGFVFGRRFSSNVLSIVLTIAKAIAVLSKAA